ncbi:hypothetical protein HZB93_01090 [Candidatus Falkowbacteria bacterium]|nr:hypothetical protein [Candidatus Falkowbacteria bacterium]
MGEVSRDLMAERSKQKEAMREGWRKVLREYFENKHEYPPLKASLPKNEYKDDEKGRRERERDERRAEGETTRRVEQFLQSRPVFARSIGELRAVQDIVVEVAIEVFDELMKE